MDWSKQHDQVDMTSHYLEYHRIYQMHTSQLLTWLRCMYEYYFERLPARVYCSTDTPVTAPDKRIGSVHTLTPITSPLTCPSACLLPTITTTTVLALPAGRQNPSLLLPMAQTTKHAYPNSIPPLPKQNTSDPLTKPKLCCSADAWHHLPCHCDQLKGVFLSTPDVQQYSRCRP